MLVTTVIPTFNRANDLGIALDSALAQTYPAHLHEIIVVDDGSTDNTAEVVARYGDRVRFLPKANGGVSAARNHGIDHACGEAIAFLDSDDSWEPEKLALQVEVLLRDPDVGLVLTSMAVVDGDRRPIGSFSRRSTLPTDGRVLNDVLKNPSMTPSSAMVRTAVAREVGGFDPALRTAEDLDFHLKIALNHAVAVVDKPLLRYTRAEGSLGTSIRTYHDYITVLTRFVAAHAGRIDPAVREAALFAGYIRNARGLAYAGEASAALGYLMSGTRHASGPRDLAPIASVLAQVCRTTAARAWRRTRQ